MLFHVENVNELRTLRWEDLAGLSRSGGWGGANLITSVLKSRELLPVVVRDK